MVRNRISQLGLASRAGRSIRKGKIMIKTSIAALVLVTMSAAAHAGCTTTRTGVDGWLEHTTCSDGSSYTTRHHGQFDFVDGQDSNGTYRSGTRTHIGDFTFSSGPLFDDDD